MRGLVIWLLVGLCVGGCTALFDDVDKTPAWSQKVWEKEQKQNAERLAGEDQGRSVVQSAWRAVTAPWNWTWQWITRNTPDKAARKMHDTQSPDRRREGIYYFADREYGRDDPYVARYRQMAEMDEDFTVRAAAIRSLNRSRDRQSVPLFVRALEDSSPLVRLEAAKALANLPDESAVPALITHLKGKIQQVVERRTVTVDEDRDVRIAAADALRNFDRPDVTQALVSVLQDRDFGVAWQANRSLRFITGKDFQWNQAAWLAHLAGQTKPVG